MADTLPTIRVLNFCGDYDDLNAVNIIGPYRTTTDRDRDIQRLTRLPDVYGSLEFRPSQIRPDTAEHSCAPEAVAEAGNLDGVLIALRLMLPPADSAAPEPTLPGL